MLRISKKFYLQRKDEDLEEQVAGKNIDRRMKKESKNELPLDTENEDIIAVFNTSTVGKVNF